MTDEVALIAHICAQMPKPHFERRQGADGPAELHQHSPEYGGDMPPQEMGPPQEEECAKQDEHDKEHMGDQHQVRGQSIDHGKTLRGLRRAPDPLRVLASSAQPCSPISGTNATSPRATSSYCVSLNRVTCS